MTATCTRDPLILRTLCDTLGFDPVTGRLISCRAHAAPDMEMIASLPEHPTFVLRYLDDQREFQHLLSTAAESVAVAVRSEVDGATLLTARYARVGGIDLHVEFSVRAAASDRFSRWRLTVENRAGLELVHVEFPFIVCADDLGGNLDDTVVVLPQGYGSGHVIRNPQRNAAAVHPKLGTDAPAVWDLTRGDGHYPGLTYAQFLALHNERAGLYLACEDTAGGTKLLKVLHRSPGLRVGVAHVGDWPRAGTRCLDYDMVLGSFTGDWYAAAGLYRDWSLQQKWGVALHRRADVPAWLLNSPVYITVHPEWNCRESLDLHPPVMPCPEFVPFDRCLPPMLDRIASRVDAPLAVILMGWERAGAWVYPDSLPWAGGETSVRAFAGMARKRGWHVGAFCSGSRWAIGHQGSGYDGTEDYQARGGPQSVCQTPHSEPVRECWDAGWRPSYECCLASELTRRLATDHVRHLVDWGLESLQFFDQNNGAATFPCYARDHGHAPVPGRWMAERMAQAIGELRQVAETAGAPGVVQSAESGVNETCLPLFQLTEFRLHVPEQGNADGSVTYIPLYQFLFHECIVIQGMMGFGPEPYHVPISNAVNAVMGSIPGGVLTGDGTLLDKDTAHFAPWQPKIGNDADGLEMIRTVATLRRGPGRDFLVLGRMQKPGHLTEVRRMQWRFEDHENDFPAVFHALWQAPDGRLGIVLANWTGESQTVTLADDHLPAAGSGIDLRCHRSARQLTATPLPGPAGSRTLTLDPLSCVLLEIEKNGERQGAQGH